MWILVNLQLLYGLDGQQTTQPPPRLTFCPGINGTPAGKAHRLWHGKPHWADGMKLHSVHWRSSSVGRWLQWRVGKIYGFSPVVGLKMSACHKGHKEM